MTEPDGPNLEEGEKTPKQREIALVGLWKRGLDTIDCVAYHNTTLESIQQLIANGGIPGNTEPSFESLDLPQIGDVYFTPRAINFPFSRLPNLLHATNSGENWYPVSYDAVYIQYTLAISHRFCSLLGLNIAKYAVLALDYIEEVNGVKPVDSLIAEKIFRELGLTDERLNAALEAARTRKGILIGLTRSALDKYPLSLGNAGDDFRISTGSHGLPTSAFSGVMPLGTEETAFFESLRGKHSK